VKILNSIIKGYPAADPTKRKKGRKTGKEFSKPGIYFYMMKISGQGKRLSKDKISMCKILLIREIRKNLYIVNYLTRVKCFCLLP
jgi:hypothetical protein